MSFTSAPFTPVVGVTTSQKNPAQGSGNLPNQAISIKNISPYLLNVADASGSTVLLIDPFTTDIAYVDAETGAEIQITPVAIGISNPQTVSPSIYLTWFGPYEKVPSGYPYGLPGASQLAASLETLGAILTGIPVPLIGGAFQTVMTTPDFGVGTWLVNASVEISGLPSSPGSECQATFVSESATATFVGPNVATFRPNDVTPVTPGTTTIVLHLSFLAVVTAAGAFALQGAYHSGVAGQANITDTGWSAVLVGA